MWRNSLYRLFSNYRMNKQNLVAHKKMLAIIIGAAIFATAGMSAASAQTSPTGTTSHPQIQGSINIEQLLLSKVTVSFTDAGNTAATKITNGKVISGSLTQMQGYLVYAFKVIDNNNMVYFVIVDPSSGQILYTSQGHSFQMGGMMGQGGMMMRGHHMMGGGAWSANKAPSGGTTAPSGSTTSSDWTYQSGMQ